MTKRKKKLISKRRDKRSTFPVALCIVAEVDGLVEILLARRVASDEWEFPQLLIGSGDNIIATISNFFETKQAPLRILEEVDTVSYKHKTTLVHLRYYLCVPWRIDRLQGVDSYEVVQWVTVSEAEEVIHNLGYREMLEKVVDSYLLLKAKGDL